MRSSITPISEIPRSATEAYLVRQGLAPELARWKFFDDAFNQGRERGFAWLREGRIGGFLGLIPARLGRGGRTWPMYWTCDWSLESRSASAGVGVRLLRRAMEFADQLLFVSEGSEHTAQLAPRIAEVTIPDAGHGWVFPLRAGYALQKLARRVALAQPERWPRIAELPLAPISRSASKLSVRSEPGVARALAALFEQPRGDAWYPHYDWNDVDWIVGRCPTLRCGSAWAPAQGTPEAAAVFWHDRASTRTWRLALWSRPGADRALRAVLSQTMREARRQGGWLLSALISRQDRDLAAALRAERWLQVPQRRPLFIFSRRSVPLEEVGRLSFLDTDLAHQIGEPR